MPNEPQSPKGSPPKGFGLPVWLFRANALTEWNQRPWSRRYIDNVLKLTSALQ